MPKIEQKLAAESFEARFWVLPGTNSFDEIGLKLGLV